ncbi:hypothetical protein GGI17_005169 [Coemansia sp. S146]|nr:hypothetical protein GGI17_005169 [Coemansia sp. S146]
MPRPTRKAAKPTTTTTATSKAAQKRANATEEDELTVTSLSGKRRLRSQTTSVPETTPPQNKSLGAAADSGIEEDDDIKESPSKRMATDVGASPGRSPKVTTPRYGRRISSGAIGHPRRLTFGNSGRRTSGASDMVFDGLIDGFSPIKRNAPPETLDFDDEEDLPQAEDVLAGKVAKPRAAAIDEEDGEEREVAADESDSELFDIDTLVARAHKPKPVGSGAAAARAMASSSLGDTSVVDLLGKGSAGELLPRRTRTRSRAPKPESAATPTKPARGRAAIRVRKTAVGKGQSSSSEEEEEEDVGDSWRPSKAANPARKSKRAAATTAAAASTTTTKRSTATSSKRAAPSRASARAKPKDLEQAASTAAWSVDPKTAKYFDDIDGFELTEEAV